MKLINRLWNDKPLALILFAGAFFRLISAIFSEGYGMHDDHFLVLEPAQSFLEGEDYNNWLPENQTNPIPSGHSWFYVGIHYVLLYLLEFVGVLDPKIKMLVIRIIHAAYSMLIISMGYKVVRKISSFQNARLAGLILALLWFFPILSVRNLVEMVCIPPLMAATYKMLKFEERKRFTFVILAAVFAGLATGIRYQAALFTFGFGLFLVVRQKWIPAIVFSVFWALAFFATQIGDLIIWHKPFAEFSEYVRYNIENKTTYFDRPWYMYLGTVAGLLIPPVSVMLMFGFGYGAKKYLAVFLPAFVFFVFHSYFPNKQERFILPVFPFVIMLGVVGWSMWKSRSSFWQKRNGLYRGMWVFFWIVNSVLLLFFTPASTKESRVEAAYWLGQQPDFNNLIVESSHSNSYVSPPTFYFGSWPNYYFTTKKMPAERLAKSEDVQNPNNKPNYVVFMTEEHLDERIERFEEGYGKEIELVKTFEPSYIDELLHELNPHNNNQTVRVYKIKE
jgi:hypothetical protein